MSGEPGSLPGLERLAADVGPLAARFREAGYRIFLVGGVVRDLAVAADRGEPPNGNDIDLTTDARPEVIKRLVDPLADAVWVQGERFGTIGALVAGHPVEITTHRAEAYDPESRKPVVSFGDDIADDLSRRDFTINAAAIELPGGELHDPHGGLTDLRDGVLRTPLSPEVSFTDDPLRMLRAARFIPRFDLAPEPELVAAATDLATRLDIVSVERVNDELEALLAVDRPRAGFDFLVGTGLLAHVFAGFARAGAAEIERAVALASASAEPPDRIVVRRAGLLWPVRDRAADQLAHLRYSRAETRRTLDLLAATEQGLAGKPGPPTVRRLAARTGPSDLRLVSILASNLAAQGAADGTAVEQLSSLIDRLGRTEDLGDLDGPLSGTDIMDLLDLDSGPEIGRAQRYLRERRIEDGPLDPDRAREHLARWWRQESGGGSSLP